MENFLTERHINDLSKIIKIEVSLFLDKYFLFIRDDYPSVISYFRGNSEILEQDIILSLNQLTKKSDLIFDSIRERRKLLDTFVMWDLVEYLDNIREDLKLIPKLWKFIRSSKTNFNYSSTFEFTHLTRQGEVLEDVSANLLGGENYQNNWQDIALRNDLLEEDYTNEVGQSLVLNLPLPQVGIVGITSIIDSPQGLRVLGLDIKKKLEFNSEGDLVVLDYIPTFEQSAITLILLRKGEIPEFRYMGRSILVGRNLKTFAVSTISRQLQQTFATDDSMYNLQISDLRLEDSDVYIRLSVESRLNNVATTQLQL